MLGLTLLVPSLLLPPAPLRTAAVPRTSAAMQFDSEATRDSSGGFDEEGGMVKGIATGGMSFAEAAAAQLADTPTLDAERAALLVLKKNGMIDLDFEVSCDSGLDTEVNIDIRPMFNTYESFICGLTADSDSSMKMTTPFEGQMDRRGGEPFTINIKIEPQGKAGELVGYVCFILPEEKAFSTYYKITCTSR
mgnify:CR=1 FL=1|tara:strand:- start:928 stop:1503 length:576 start_codon:yes stop_codon:yes gene_type:complete